MKIIFKTLLMCLTVPALSFTHYGCSASKTQTGASPTEKDLVCGMQVSKSEAFKYEYEGKKYYFDSYNCKEAFKMTPKKFIEKQEAK